MQASATQAIEEESDEEDEKKNTVGGAGVIKTNKRAANLIPEYIWIN